MLIAQEIFRPILGHYQRNLKTILFSSKVRSLSQYEITKSKRAEMRMSPNVFRQKERKIYERTIMSKSYKAIVQGVFDASQSIKVLRLFISETDFSFKAGQWVDFYVPGIKDVTGYSMTSPPHHAKEKGILDLAVKYGNFPPTHWVHNECKEGAEVVIRVGGDFYYDPEAGSIDETADLLLIGGGVGVNPLVSILSEYCHLLDRTREPSSGIRPGKVHVMYSAKNIEELVFMEKFKAMENEHPSISCLYYITNPGFTSSHASIKCHRIQESDIKDSLMKLQADKVLCFICGPSTMTDDMATTLLKLGVKQDFIRYEKWW